MLTPGSFVWQSVHPIDPDRCAVRTGGAFSSAPPVRPRGRLAKRIIRSVGNAAYPLPDFLPEDRAICERGQRGAAGDFAPGRLVPIERVVADFGHYLNWRLNAIEPPAVHTEAHP